jgi:hypothetical protein
MKTLPSNLPVCAPKVRGQVGSTPNQVFTPLPEFLPVKRFWETPPLPMSRGALLLLGFTVGIAVATAVFVGAAFYFTR